MSRGFNIPWILFGVTLTWVVEDLAKGKFWMVLFDVALMAFAYLMVEKRIVHM